MSHGQSGAIHIFRSRGTTNAYSRACTWHRTGIRIDGRREQSGKLVDHYDGVPPEAITPATPAARGYSPYAGRKYPTRPLFGDTHHHTSNSGDAFMAGNRLSPEEAYRFARGEEVVSSTGVPAKLSRPLDFLVISDHAEGLGIDVRGPEGNPALVSDPTLARMEQGHEGRRQGGGDAMNELISAQAQTRCRPRSRIPRSSDRS